MNNTIDLTIFYAIATAYTRSHTAQHIHIHAMNALFNFTESKRHGRQYGFILRTAAVDACRHAIELFSYSSWLLSPSFSSSSLLRRRTLRIQLKFHLVNENKIVLIPQHRWKMFRNNSNCAKNQISTTRFPLGVEFEKLLKRIVISNLFRLLLFSFLAVYIRNLYISVVKKTPNKLLVLTWNDLLVFFCVTLLANWIVVQTATECVFSSKCMCCSLCILWVDFNLYLHFRATNWFISFAKRREKTT